MTEIQVFGTTDPGVLAEWEAFAEAQLAFNATRAALEEEFGRPTVGTTGGFSGESKLTGLDPTDDDLRQPPDGWRLQAQGGSTILVPIRRSAAGRALAERFTSVTTPGPSFTGMPHFVFQNGRFLSAGYRKPADTLYARWSTNAHIETLKAASWGGHKLDLDLWPIAKLSTYYAEVERQEEALAEAKV